MTDTIAFQGVAGAYSDRACRRAYPEMATLPRRTFRETFAAVSDGLARHAMIPIENSVAGRVADIHQLLPESGLHIVAEHFERVRHHLLAVKGADPAALKTVHSHVHALSQCRKVIERMGLQPIVHADTAGAAAEVAERNDPSATAIASELAAEIYGLDIVEAGIEDESHNTTRFVILSRDKLEAAHNGQPVITTFIFRVRNVPAALYKALGGFATNGVNMTKLESYQLEGQFFASMFYADVEGHPEDPAVALALEELAFFCAELNVLGVYRASPFREKIKEPEANRALRPNPNS